jgi:phage gp46-like protein
VIALDWGQTRITPDLALAPSGAVAREDGLRTAILLSLFLDARAGEEDPLPDPLNRDRRGWVGDVLAPTAGDRIGSRLWLLARALEGYHVTVFAYGQTASGKTWTMDGGSDAQTRGVVRHTRTLSHIHAHAHTHTHTHTPARSAACCAVRIYKTHMLTSGRLCTVAPCCACRCRAP